MRYRYKTENYNYKTTLHATSPLLNMTAPNYTVPSQYNSTHYHHNTIHYLTTPSQHNSTHYHHITIQRITATAQNETTLYHYPYISKPHCTMHNSALPLQNCTKQHFTLTLQRFWNNVHNFRNFDAILTHINIVPQIRQKCHIHYIKIWAWGNRQLPHAQYCFYSTVEIDLTHP